MIALPAASHYVGRMELYQLRSFVVVAEEGHLTRASERLHTSQPALSGHIKSLEQELDTKLFLRTPKGMQLTSAGQRLKLRAEQVLAAAEEMRDEARSLNENLTGEVRIGLNTDSDYLHLVSLLGALTEAHPGISVQLMQSSSKLTAEELRSGRLDAGFMFGRPRGKDIHAIFLDHTRFYLAVPDIWADHISGDPARLANLPWIREPGDSLIQRLFDTFFATHHIQPSTVLEVDGDEIIRVLVAAGKGVTLLSANEIETTNRIGGQKVHAVPLDGMDMDLYFATLKRRDQDPIMRAVIHQVQKVWEIPELRS